MVRWWRVALAVLLMGIVVVGCGRQFEPYWRVDKLRVMAVKGDPVVARAFEPVTLSALVWAPPGQEISYFWSWCPVRTSAGDDFECPLDEDLLEDLGANDFDGGNGDNDNGDGDNGDIDDLLAQLLLNADEPEATFLNPFGEEEVRAFCEAIVAAVLEAVDDPELAGFLPGGDCSQGYEVSIRLEVQAGDERVVTSKRLTLWGGAEEVNENPRMEGIAIRPEDPDDLDALIAAGWDIEAGADHDDQWVLIPPGEELVVLEDVVYEVRGALDPESILTYTPPTPQGQSQPRDPRQEAFVFRYFTTGGNLGGSRRLFAPPQNTLEEAPITTFRVSAEDRERRCMEPEGSDCRVRLWSIARDGRLGLDWAEAQLLVRSR